MIGRIVIGLALVAHAARALAVTGSSPITLTPDGGSVWVVNPDSGTVARIDTATNVRVGEFAVGSYPRTVAVTSTGVYVTVQHDDAVIALGPDGSPIATATLAFGCAPYGIAARADGGELYVSCQGSAALIVLSPTLFPLRSIALGWPEPRAVVAAPDGKVYVTHYITKEPNHTGHVSEVDPATGTITRVLEIPPDFASCETLGSGQGVANVLGSVAVGTAGASAGELWVGGIKHNSLRKGLFERSQYFQDRPGIALFPDLLFGSSPEGEGGFARRNIYKPGLHDIARAVIWKLDLASGVQKGAIDLAGGGAVGDIAFSTDGNVAYAVDLMANAYSVFHADRGENGNPVSVFGPVAAGGEGGASPATPCTGKGTETVGEDPYLLAPQARLVPSGLMDPLSATDLTFLPTGVEFSVAANRPRAGCVAGQMCPVGDGVGTTPHGIALGADGTVAYVANYLARNVTVVNATPAGFRCQNAPGTSCSTRADCGGATECMPLVRAVVASTASDPLPPEILDGKILFTTSARAAAGAAAPIPPFNLLLHDGSQQQGEVTSIGRDGASLSCFSCHPDFGGQDGRTWDFSQFSASLRNTMDLRGRASFAPGHCSQDANIACTFDAACGAYGSGNTCVNNPSYIPPNIKQADRSRYFNPMGSAHWNGDRDEVEDFEFTLRELAGASDCDGNEEKAETCVGGLVQRRFVAGATDARADLFEPNRHRSPRLDHLGDYVYSLTAFPGNPNLGPGGVLPSDAARRGRLLFNDPVVHCSFCHNGPSPGNQQFTNKGPNSGYDPNITPRADLNSPFLRNDVGTANVFDRTNPFLIASDGPGLLGFTLFQNEQIPQPGNRATLNAYITPVLNDVWNTAPYLHDGSAGDLLAVVRPCLTRLDTACEVAGKGRNVDDQHGVTSFLSARQLNDLAAFQAAPHGPIGEVRAINNALLDVQALAVRFGRKARTDTLAVRGSARLSQAQQVDPATSGVTVSIGVPRAGRMDAFARTLPASLGKGNRSGTSFKFVDTRADDGQGTPLGGRVTLVLKVKAGQLAFRLSGKKLDLSVLEGVTPDLTVALEFTEETTVASTRRFRTNKAGTRISGPGGGRRRG